MSEDKSILQFPKDRKSIDLSAYEKAIGLEISSDFTDKKEVPVMSEYISRKEFEQYEKRIDENFRHLNSKLDSLPNTLTDKITISLNDYENRIRKGRKEDKRSIITWSISGTSLLIAILGLIAKFLGWY
ncbi:hypothetical protein MXL81_07825 [Staphylococcus pseudoxylosus]|uniref:hypothetical protein n=1 Tax=Staphylococcus pseudoxylosus TaxID=2282419 RepID=UPI002DBE3B74|nr:hypothetical protein [Staphylococcus pseudoxylosus]MEB6170582.1 hypothetical protein [Staphylococcus pseudoxylosus]